jgi:hypothetical protein
MKVVFFLLGLAHVIILFASVIALAIFIVVRLAKWLWRVCTIKPAARQQFERPQKEYLSPSEGALRY